jgi:hypothetical protein
MPKRIANCPQLALGLGLYYEAFWELISCRDGWTGMIPWTAVMAYCDRNGFNAEMADDVLHHVRKMEQAFNDFRTKKAEQ